MKYLFIAVCVAGVAWAFVQRFYLKTDSHRERVAEVQAPPQVTGPTYVTMEASGPVFRITPETRAKVDRFTTEKVVLFGASWCTYCAAERKLFADKGVRYVEIDIDRDPSALTFMQNVLGVPAVPATIFGTRLVPGYNAQELDDAVRRL